jgi:hypothetical protein
MLLIIGSVSAEQIIVPSTDSDGVIWTAPTTETYRFTYTGGAVRGPDSTGSLCGYCLSGAPCWSNVLYFYKNREPTWGGTCIKPGCCSPVNPDYVLGTGNYQTSQQAEAAAKGTYFDLPLNQGDRITLLCPDYSNSPWSQNTGNYFINVQIVNKSPVAAFDATTASTTSSPVTISTTGQVPNTNSGNSGFYLTIIIVLIVILCIGGVYSLYMSRKKNSVDVAYSEQKPQYGSTSSKTNADDNTNFRSSSFENGSTHHDIFISYSHEDKAIADAICAMLESHTIRCWIAPRDVLPGEDYPASIINAIEQCRIMVLVYSSKSNNSDHVIRELTKAVSSGAIIIPFRIEDIPLSKNMEYLIGIPHWLDALTPPLEQHIDKLVETVKVLLKKAKTK